MSLDGEEIWEKKCLSAEENHAQAEAQILLNRTEAQKGAQGLLRRILKWKGFQNQMPWLEQVKGPIQKEGKGGLI